MSVEGRLRQYAEALTRELAETDRNALRERTLAASQATDGRSRDACGSQSPAGHHPVAGTAEELRYHLKRAERGDAASAIRLAELNDLLGREDEAARWWRHAADLDDPHAIDYVQEFIAPVDTTQLCGTDPHRLAEGGTPSAGEGLQQACEASRGPSLR